MGKFLLTMLLIVFFGVLWSLPVYLCINLILWAFHISFRLTILQAFVICLSLNIMISVLSGRKDDK